MGSVCNGNSCEPLIFLDPPVLRDQENILENEEDLGRLYRATGTSGVHFRTAPKIFNTTFERPTLAPKSKSTVVINQRRRVSCEKSLKQRIEERKRNTVMGIAFIRDECEAMQYCDGLEKDTWMELKDTCQIAETIVQKGANIKEELARNDRVIHEANRDMHSTEQDINETSWRLKGMKSLRCKIGNMIWHRKPKAQAFSDFYESRDFRTPSTSMSPYSTHISPKRTTQQQIKAGVVQLSMTLDKVRSQQLAIADKLQHQEEQFKEFDINMGRIHGKIHQQNDFMNSIKVS